jgi:hypothetical protein
MTRRNVLFSLQHIPIPASRQFKPAHFPSHQLTTKQRKRHEIDKSLKINQQIELNIKSSCKKNLLSLCFNHSMFIKRPKALPSLLFVSFPISIIVSKTAPRPQQHPSSPRQASGRPLVQRAGRPSSLRLRRRPWPQRRLASSPRRPGASSRPRPQPWRGARPLPPGGAR